MGNDADLVVFDPERKRRSMRPALSIAIPSRHTLVRYWKALSK